MEQSKTSLRQIAFIGNYLPRQCGIATFTTDLCESISKQFADTNCFALAMNDNGTGYKYPPRCVSNWLNRISARIAVRLTF